ncbi:MAG: thymidine kinase, partial [Phycisphaerales bacterium]
APRGVCSRMPPPTRARLVCICGPMFAGKSTLLLARGSAARARGLRVRAFKPRRDTRYDPTTICTHTGATGPCEVIDDAREITQGDAEVTLIDEAHFLGSALVDPIATLLGRPGTVEVVVAGLERDHRGHAFSPFDQLLVEADEVVKLSSVCAVCGAPAVHSQRMVAGSERIVVGGAESYQPRCRVCFQPGA